MQFGSLLVHVVVEPMFGENAYIAHLQGRDDCLIVDPSFDTEAICEYIERQSLCPSAILNTHGHADHISGNRALKQRWPDCPLVIGSNDAIKLEDPVQNLSRPFGMDVTSPEADHLVEDGDRYQAAGIPLEVADTPGHSLGHVIFVWRGGDPWVVFGGDVLFQGGIGRTDFPDGDMQQLADSIRDKLYTLPPTTIVLPGHGPPTTVADEMSGNPFVRGAP